MKPEIKLCTGFGTGGHIPMSRHDVGKKFLIFPEDSKYILADIIKEYHKAMEKLINPKLSQFLSRREYYTVKKAYRKLITIKSKTSGLFVGMHKKFLESSHKDLHKFRVNDISMLLNEIEKELPKKLRIKLLAEFYKKEGRE